MSASQGRLHGKRAIVTAAAQGIGRATAIAFLREGAEVLATDINTDALATLVAAHPAMQTRRMDVRSDSSVADAVAAWGRTDVLFNCAGIVHQGSILDAKSDELSLALDLNVHSMFRTIRACLPSMLEHGCGSIVNMASVASSLKGVPNRFAYQTSKAAVIGLTKSVAADFVARGIRCNAVCPGTVQTPSLDERINALGGGAEIRNAFVARQPIGRLGTPEEIAELVLHLAGDESSYTTGATFVVDGGWSC
ncbi:MAG: SDR family oxidoreductase [Phycisphaerales bacterium]|nr:SDR family oxidoreductase [Phycisphaerales bacterium]